MKLKNQNILIISNEPWGDVWYSKHNYAYELSKENKVIFLNPAPRWKVSNLLGGAIKEEKISPSLSVVDYVNVLPSSRRPLYGINNLIVSQQIRRYLEKTGFDNWIYWTFDPYRLHDPKAMGAATSIFHCVDHFDFQHHAEKLLAESVDGFIIVSQDFAQDYQQFDKPILHIPHGISTEEFEVPLDMASRFDLDQENFLLYVGNIDERLDFELIEKTVAQFPHTPFVFVGNTIYGRGHQLAKKLFEEKPYDNLIHLGPRPFKALKLYISKAKACLAPMNPDHPGNTISHHKIFQYLAFGKPVFSIEFSEYTSIADLLYMDNDHDRLLQKMKTFLEEGEQASLSEKRIHTAAQYQYPNLFRKIEDFITQEMNS